MPSFLNNVGKNIKIPQVIYFGQWVFPKPIESLPEAPSRSKILHF